MANFYKSALLCLVFVITVANGYPGACCSIPEEQSYELRADVEDLKNAIDHEKFQQIIDIVTKRTRDERLQIVRVYKKDYRVDLIETLKSALTGNFNATIVALMTPLYDYYAQELHHAVESAETDDDTIVEILSTLKPREFYDVRKSYKRLYKKSLECDLARETVDDHQRLIAALIRDTRDENSEVDEMLARNDARFLYVTAEGEFSPDEYHFMGIMARRSYAQLRQMFVKYKEAYGEDVESAIDKRYSHRLRKLLLGMVKSIKSKVDYLAERLHKSVAGEETDDRTLVRILVTRSEIDLPEIIKAFDRVHRKTFGYRIESRTSGDYQKALLAIVTEAVDRHP